MALILVVDDDQFNLRVVSATLKRSNYEVVTAQSGKEALKLLSEVEPDLVISDVMMPEMDGYELCRRLRKRTDTAHLPIMMLTSSDSLEYKLKGFEAGADDYLLKPFEREELEVRIKALLRRAVKQQVESDSANGKITAVYSLRGGVGVSTLATNLALGLQQLWGSPTVLVDLALTCGHSALMFNQPLHNTWHELGAIPVEELELEVVEKVLLRHESGLALLAAPARPVEREIVSAGHVDNTLQLLKEHYRYLVLDLPHDFSETTLAGLDLAQEILVMLAPEIPSVYAAQRTLETFRNLGYDLERRISLVLNWTFERRGLSRRDIERVIGKEIDFVLPYAPGPLINALNLGTPVLLDNPTSSLGARLEEVAYQVSLSDDRDTEPATPSPAWKRVIKLLKK